MADQEATGDRPIDGALFSRYAEDDLDRWRQLITHEVVHADPRWGVGEVEDVRWGTCCDHVSAYVQVRVRYAEQGLVVFRASSFDVHHRFVAVPAEVRRVIRACFEETRNEAEREAILVRHSREIRAARDCAKVLKRVEALRWHACREPRDC